MKTMKNRSVQRIRFALEQRDAADGLIAVCSLVKMFLSKVSGPATLVPAADPYRLGETVATSNNTVIRHGLIYKTEGGSRCLKLDKSLAF